MDRTGPRPLRALTPKELNMRESSVLQSSGRPRLFNQRFGAGSKTSTSLGSDKDTTPPPSSSKPSALGNFASQRKGNRTARTSSGSLPAARNLSNVFRNVSPAARVAQHSRTTSVNTPVAPPKSPYSIPQHLTPAIPTIEEDEERIISSRKSLPTLSTGEREGIRRPKLRAPEAWPFLAGETILTPKSLRASQQIKREADKVVRLEQKKREMIALAQENSQEVIKTLANHSTLVELELARKNKDASLLRAEKLMADSAAAKLRSEIDMNASELALREKSHNALQKTHDAIKFQLARERSERASETFSLEAQLTERSETLVKLQTELESMRNARQHIELMLKDTQDEGTETNERNAQLQTQCKDLASELSQKIAEIELARSTITLLRTELEKSSVSLKASAEEDRALRTRTEILQSETSALAAKSDNLSQKLNEVERARQDLEASNVLLLEDLQTKEAQAAELQKRIELLDLKQAESQKESERVRTILRELEASVASKQASMDELESSKVGLELRNSELDNLLVDAKERVAVLEETVVRSAAEVDETQIKVSRLSRHENKLMSELDSLVEANRMANEERYSLVGKLDHVEAELIERELQWKDQEQLIITLKEEIELINIEVDRVKEEAHSGFATAEQLTRELAASEVTAGVLRDQLKEAEGKLTILSEDRERICGQLKATESKLLELEANSNADHSCVDGTNDEEVTRLQEELKVAEEELRGLSEEMADVQYNCDSLCEQRNQAFETTATLESSIQKLKKEKSEQDDFLIEAQKAGETLVRQLREASSREKQQQEKLSEKERLVSVTRSSLSDMKHKIIELSAALGEKEKEVDDLKVGLANADRIHSIADDQVAKIEEIEDEHQEMVEKLRETEDLLVQRSEEVDNISARLIKTDRELGDAKKELDRVEEECAELKIANNFTTPLRSLQHSDEGKDSARAFTPSSLVSPSSGYRGLLEFGEEEEEALNGRIAELRQTVSSLACDEMLGIRLRELEQSNGRLNFELTKKAAEHDDLIIQYQCVKKRAEESEKRCEELLREKETEVHRLRECLASHGGSAVMKM